MADVAIVNRATIAAPKDYTLSANEEFTLKAVRALVDGSGATLAFLPCLQILAPDGTVMWQGVPATSIAVGGTADVSWFPDVEGGFSGAAQTSDSFYLDTRSSAGVTSSIVLQSGVEYLITATGSWSYINHALDVGTPDANAVYPTDPAGRLSTQVGFDPETLYAYWSGSPPGGAIGHSDAFRINLGGGFSHLEPSDGAHTVPTTGHVYSYKVVGQGSPASFLFVDAPGQYADNYGYVLITITQLGQTDVPPVGPANSILRSIGGVATWAAQPDITEADLSLSDVTTDDVSTTRHGFVPKAPNDASKFLNGVGAYSTPSGADPLTTKGDIFGYDTGPNRIPVGSDNTVLTADSTQALGVKWATVSGGGGGIIQIAQKVLTTGDLTTSSQTFVDATGVTVTLTTGAHRCLVIFSGNGGNFSGGSGGCNVAVDLAIDGTRQGGAFGLVIGQEAGTTSVNHNLSFCYLTASLSAASHTFKIQWRVNLASTTATLYASTAVTPAILTVVELGI